MDHVTYWGNTLMRVANFKLFMQQNEGHTLQYFTYNLQNLF